MKTTIDYNQQALDFLAKCIANMTIEKTGHGKYFNDDTNTRDIYTVTLRRSSKNKPVEFTFGASIVDSGK